jgi:molecular chaperone GrpE (heat shock protein)
VRLAVVEMDEDLKRTGKTGYYRLVAEAENLRRRRKEEMASLEVEVKRTMVEKFLGILDGLVTIPTKFPATTDKERNIYSNFHVLSDQARGQFESLGMVYVTPGVTCFINAFYRGQVGLCISFEFYL